MCCDKIETIRKIGVKQKAADCGCLIRREYVCWNRRFGTYACVVEAEECRYLYGIEAIRGVVFCQAPRLEPN